MLRLAIVNHQGGTVPIKELETVAELAEVSEQARLLIRECDRLSKLKAPLDTTKKPKGAPYLT